MPSWSITACSSASGAGIQWTGPYRPSYKPTSLLEPAATGGDVGALLDADGLLRLLLVFHRGEDPASVQTELAVVPGVTVDLTLVPAHEAAGHVLRRTALVINPQEAGQPELT